MKELTASDVREWIRNVATGEFHYKQIKDGTIDPQLFPKLRNIMSDLIRAKDPVVETVGKKDGYFRPIQDLPEPLSFKDVKKKMEFPLILPFDLRKYVFIYPKTVTVVAGSKSSAKTGFLYRTAVLNMNNTPTVLLSNMEGGMGQMVDRFTAMGVDLNSSPLTVYNVCDNFHDFVKQPTTLYLIDYIDAPEGTEFYIIGGLITKIQRKLDISSVAVIGLQKPFRRDIAYGGEGTLKDATLYLALDTHKIKIVDAKVPADDTISPKNMQWTFRLTEKGTQFTDIQPYYGSQSQLGDNE